MRKGKNGIRRIAALVCSVALFATLLPVQVLAADEATSEPLAAVTLLEESGEEKAPEQGETGIQPETENACTKSEDCAAETHEEGCPKYVAPAEEEDTDPVVSCTKSEDCAAETHEEGCPKYVAPDEDEDTDPVVSCTKSEDCVAETHEEGCPKYVAPEGEDGAPQVPDKEDPQDLPQTAPSAGSNESAPETVSEESDNNLAQKDEPLDENTTPPEGEREAEKIAVFQEIEERNLSEEEKAALLQYTNTNQQPNAATQRLMTSALQERAVVRFAEPAKVTYTKANDTTVSDEVTLEDAVDALNAAGGGVITVTKSGYTSKTSLRITSDITIQADSPVTIGYAEGQQSYDYLNLFTLASGATLTLGKGDNAEDLLTVDGSGGSESSTMFYLSSWETHKLSLNIRDGVILTGATGPVVDIYTASENTTLNMTGGQIINNNASDTLIRVGHFNMSGGTIAHNRVYDEDATGFFGYAVIFPEDDAHIEGDALIEDCHAGPYSGAAIRLTSASDCYIGGKAIIRNCTGMNGGAIEVDSRSADVTIEGNAQIINCRREENAPGGYRYMGGAIYFSSSGTLTIQGNAKIEGCSSPVAGAIAVYYNNDKTSQCIIKGNAQIVGNTGNYGGAIFAQNGARVEVSENATISGNTAKIAGGGIAEMMFGSESVLGTPVIPEVSLKGGKITGNKAPMGAGVCMAGASEAWEWFGNDIKKSYMDVMEDLYEDDYENPADLEKKLEEVSQAYDDSVVTGPCVLNIADGASVTGNTATEQGGGIWVGWDVSPKISGAIHVTGNTLENGTANDIYLDRDPNAPEDPVVPEWPEESEEPEEPGNEPSFEEFLEFVHTLAAQTAKDALEAASDSDVVQSAQDLGYLREGVTADDLSPEEMASLRDWLEEQLIIAQSNNLISSDNIIAQYKNTYNAKPSLDVFKQTAKVVYEDYVVLVTKAFSIGWTFDPANEKVVEAASGLGLAVENGRYTGTEEQFWQAYKAYAVEYEFGEVTDEEWQAAYDKASEEKEEPEEPEEPEEVRDARLAVTGALTGSQIGVFVEGQRAGRVFAYGNGYTLTPEDLAVFTVENPGYSGAGTTANTLVLKRPVVEIAPADMVIYMGGSNGYDSAIVDTETGAIKTSNSLPEPGFTVKLPDGVQAQELTLQYKQDDTTTLQWSLVPYDGATGHNIYRVEPKGDSKTQVRMVFTNSKGETITEDRFDASKNLNQTLTVKVYGKGIAENKVSILCDSEEYPIQTSEGKVTVRGTTDDVNYGNMQIAPAEDYTPALNQVGVAVTADTIFTVNGSNAQVDPEGQIALLFDNIIDSNAVTGDKNYTDLLKDKAETTLAVAENDETRQYEFRYLDLVDRNNGNTWVTAQNANGEAQTVTVYWPLPAGTDENTQFKVLHFEKLNRSMSSQEIVNTLTSTEYAPAEAKILRVTDTHVVFETTGFSPFALVWDTAENQPTQPDGDGNEQNEGTNNQGSTNNTTAGKSSDATKTSAAAAQSASATSSSAIPQTGDAMPVGLLGGVTVVAAAAFAALFVLRKRKHND